MVLLGALSQLPDEVAHAWRLRSPKHGNWILDDRFETDRRTRFHRKTFSEFRRPDHRRRPDSWNEGSLGYSDAQKRPRDPG